MLRVLFWLFLPLFWLFLTNWRSLWRDRFIDKAPAVRLIWPTLLSEPPPPPSLSLQYSSSPLARVSMKNTSYLGLNLIPFALWQTAEYLQCNWVNVWHTLICCSFIQASRGVTNIKFLHRILYVWCVPWRKKIDNAVKLPRGKLFWCANQRKEPFIPCFFLSTLLNNSHLIILLFLLVFVAAQHLASLSYFQVDIFTGGRGAEVRGVVRGRCHAWLCDRAWQRAWERARKREHVSLVVRRVWWHFMVLPCRGAERIRAGLISSTSRYNLQRPRLKRCYRVSCKLENGYVLTFSLEYCGLLLDGANIKTMTTSGVTYDQKVQGELKTVVFYREWLQSQDRFIKLSENTKDKAFKKHRREKQEHFENIIGPTF